MLSNIIAFAALIVSVLAIYRSETAADRIRAETARDASSASKADLLIAMADCEAVLNDARAEIGTVKAIFDAENDSVKGLLIHYTSLFTELYPRIQLAQTTWAADRAAVQRWDGALPLADWMREKARIHGDLRNFQHAARMGYQMAATFREKLSAAQAFVQTRGAAEIEATLAELAKQPRT